MTSGKEFAWSYTALNRFQNCPKQYWHLNLVKDVKDEDSEASAEGRLIHEALCARIVRGAQLPIQLRHLEGLATKFLGLPGHTQGELKFAMSRDFRPVGFFARDVFVRVVVDLLNTRGDTAIVVDWKTGRPRLDFTQLRLSAAVLAVHAPEIKTFKMAYVWTGHDKISPLTMSRDELLGVWNDLLPKVAEIERAIGTTTFPAKQSGLCRYCPVTQCPHNPNG